MVTASLKDKPTSDPAAFERHQRLPQHISALARL
jgi:hypothetical protein